MREWIYVLCAFLEIYFLFCLCIVGSLIIEKKMMRKEKEEKDYEE